jgi:hypothetical protein
VQIPAATSEGQARYWNSDEAARWLLHEQRDERMLAPFTAHLLTAAGIECAERVISDGVLLGSGAWLVTARRPRQ